MMQYWNPKWCFQTSFSDELRLKTEQMFEEYINQDDNFSTPAEWNCNVKTTWGSVSGQDIWREWFDLLQPVWEEFFNEYKSKFPVKVQTENAWINKYNPGDFQELHDHCTPTTVLSMVYFHTLNDDDDCRFEFFNDDVPLLLAQNPIGRGEWSQGPLELLQRIAPSVKSGDVIIFPPHYLHLVTPHRGTKTRVTFSMNFNLIPVPTIEVAQ